MPSVRFFIPRLAWSGGVQQILRTAAGLSKRGHDVSVCNLDNISEQPNWFGERLKFVSLSEKADVDVMFENGPGDLAEGKRVLFRLNEGVWYPEDEQKNLAAAWDGVLCVSRSLCADSLARWPLLPVGYAPPGVDDELSHGAPTEEKTVGFLAHVAPFKRCAELMKILHPLKSKGVKILAYGLANSALIDEHFGSPDFAKLANIYRRCALWLVPSSAEGFPLPALEAAACGAVPIVANDRDYDFKGGLHIPFGDFSGEITDLLADTERRLALRERAILLAEEYRSWETTVDAAEKVISKCLT